MAIFSNQATLTYNGTSTNSNIAYGEILDVLVATKTAIEGTYSPDSLVTYAVTLRNTGNTPITGLTVSDNLGAYEFNEGTITPLTYESGSATLFIDGVLQPDPAVTAGPPLTVSGISVPANGDTVLIYQARTNSFADPTGAGVITNTAIVTGDGLSTSVIATESISSNPDAVLTITKAISPSQVVDNDRVTYTFVIENSGNRAIIATDSAAVSDTFDPILTDLAVSFNGNTWTEGTQYTYNESTGLFTTLSGQILVPAATYVQDPITGAFTGTPGVVTLTVTGTI